MCFEEANLLLPEPWRGRVRKQLEVSVKTVIFSHFSRLGCSGLRSMNVLLLALYSRAEVGFYSLAFRVAVLPLSLISGSLSEVFFQKASASYRKTGGFWNELVFNIVVSAALSVFIFVPLALLARPLFAIAFGSTCRGGPRARTR